MFSWLLTKDKNIPFRLISSLTISSLTVPVGIFVGDLTLVIIS
ncbi:hypothetical protein GO456_11050 [Leclercia adecarboxylata]|nr:hypothetical protein [Leclercia adecarboxylata]